MKRGLCCTLGDWERKCVEANCPQLNELRLLFSTKLACWSKENDGRESAVSGPGGFPAGRCLKHGKHCLTRGETVVLGAKAEPVLLRKGFMRTRILIGSGTLWPALRLGGCQAHASQTGTVVAWGDQVLPAVSLGTRFMALAVGSLLSAERKRFVSQQTMCSPGLFLAASQDKGQEA